MNPILKKICQLAKSGNREIQFASLRILAQLNVKDKEAIRLLGEILQKTTDVNLRELILDIPAKTGNSQYLPYLIPCLGNPSFNRERLIQSIAGIGGSVVSPLEKRYPKALEYEKESILMTLGRIPTKQSITLLLRALLDSQQVERLRLICGLLKNPVEQLKKSDRSWFKRFLLKQVKRPQTKKNSSLMVSHLILLGQLRDTSLKSFFLKTQNESLDLFVKKYALIALMQLGCAGKGHDDIIKGLIPTLSHSDFPNIVKNAISVLEKLEIPKKLQKEVSKLLENQHPSVRSFALSKLGTFDSGENVSTLIGYLSSPDPRIRDAAKTSLEKMPKAGKALLARFENSTQIDQMNQMVTILRQHKNLFTGVLCRKLFLKMEKLKRGSNEIFREYLALLKNANPDFLFKEVMKSVNTSKKRKKWDQVLEYIGFIEGSFLFTHDVKFELAIAKLKTSKLDYAQTYRDQNHGLLILQGLIKNNREEACKWIVREKALSPEERYFIGFHFAEKQFELREFGIKLLKITSKTRNKLGRQAKQKLAMLVAV